MSDRVVTFDASCECGAVLRGAWSGEECDDWAETHEHIDDEDESDD